MLFENLVVMLEELNTFSIVTRLLLSMLCGGLIGIDRARKRRPAGLRTYMLVSLGATLVMITNQFIVMKYPGSDPARLGAQVISGIGFLGVGTIIVTRHHQVIGLTTAAGLWGSACMGLALGIGFYEGALFACAFIVIIMVIIQRFDNIMSSTSKVMEIFVEFSQSGKLSDFLGYMRNHNVQITYLDIVKPLDSESKGIAALITLRMPRRCEHFELLQRLTNIEGVNYVDEV